MLSNTLRPNFCYLKISHIFHSHCHPKIIGNILKNNEKNEQVSIPEIIRLIVMKIKMKMKNGSRIYDINLGTRKNRARSRHGHDESEYDDAYLY